MKERPKKEGTKDQQQRNPGQRPQQPMRNPNVGGKEGFGEQGEKKRPGRGMEEPKRGENPEEEDIE